MARDEAPPFQRGTYETQDAFSHLLGKEWDFEDVDLNSGVGAKAARTGKKVTCRLVQNVSGAALLPKRLVRTKNTGTPQEFCGAVDGYCAVGAERGFPVDEYLPAAGVPNLAYFYVVVGGPAIVKLPLALADWPSDIAVGDRLVALTAVTSGATSSGRITKENLTGSSQATDNTFIANQIANRVGRALSAAASTNANTNADILVDLDKAY